MRLIKQFGINPKTKVKELSRGMGMKLQIAVALSHGTDLLLLDEATAGLDPLARDEILDMLQAFVGTGERGVLLSSHITTDLERIADRDRVTRRPIQERLGLLGDDCAGLLGRPCFGCAGLSPDANLDSAREACRRSGIPVEDFDQALEMFNQVDLASAQNR